MFRLKTRINQDYINAEIIIKQKEHPESWKKSTAVYRHRVDQIVFSMVWGGIFLNSCTLYLGFAFLIFSWLMLGIK